MFHSEGCSIYHVVIWSATAKSKTSSDNVQLAASDEFPSQIGCLDRQYQIVPGGKKKTTKQMIRPQKCFVFLEEIPVRFVWIINHLEEMNHGYGQREVLFCPSNRWCTGNLHFTQIDSWQFLWLQFSVFLRFVNISVSHSHLFCTAITFY